MKADGGTSVRRRMIDGRAQFWVVRRDGAAVAAFKLADLARHLGLGGEDMNKKKSSPRFVRAAGPRPTDLINSARAAKITGYAVTTLHRMATAGKLKAYPTITSDGVPHPRYMLYSAAEISRWAEAHKAEGGQYQPRIRRKKTRTIAEPSANGVRPMRRLERFLKRWEGTPVEISREEFIEKAVEAALDKIEA